MKVTTLRQTKFIPAKPAEVYDAFMKAKIHVDFTGSKATSNPRVGGRFTAWDGYITGKNLKLKKGKLIVQEWKTTEWPEGYSPSILNLSFKQNKGGTQVTMVQSNVPASQARNYRQGWVEAYWDPLRRYFQKKRAR
jgi:activator of HSP90 ATPase